MADQKAPQMQATLGLTGLTSNAMALIAPGAFLWLTFFIQATTGVAGQPSTAPSMWMGIFSALLLCLATAVAYAEISKLYPGTGSSYYYAEQAMLSKDASFKYARIAKFIVGWGSHLYYWVYPGVMVATTGIFVGYVVGFLFPSFLSGSNPGPLFMALVAIVVLVLRGVDRVEGRRRLDGGEPCDQRRADFGADRFQRAGAGISLQPSGRNLGADHVPIRRAVAVDLHLPVRDRQGRLGRPRRQRRTSAPAGQGRQAGSVHDGLPGHGRQRQHADAHQCRVGGRHPQVQLGVHSGHCRDSDPGRIRIRDRDGRRGQEPTKHIPIAVIASLLIQGLVCYLFEYFAANYFLNSGYTMQSAAGSAAPIGDMMIIVGDALLGPGSWQVLHAGRSVHRVPGPHRDNAELHEHRRPRNLCHGQGRRSSRALRHASRRFAFAAARYLDSGLHLRRHRRAWPSRLCLPMPPLPPTRPSPHCPTTSSRAGVTCRTTRWPSCPTPCWPSPSLPTSARSSCTR